MRGTDSTATALAALMAACGLALAAPAAAFAQAAASGAPDLAAHRAVYDLKLTATAGKRALQSVRGRILYDFTGNACDGYSLQFRQVTELDSGEGKSVTSDLRMTNWEDGAGKSFRFMTQNFLDGRAGQSADGRAEEAAGGIAVKLTKPQPKSLDIGAAVFPSEHMRRVILAARAGRTVVEVPVYDGSETGEKVYNTMAVIGAPIAPDTRKPGDAAAGQQALAGLTRWPVTVSYFDRAKAGSTGGEQTPAYAITFELYENGISRALKLDYGDFTLTGEMTTLEVRDSKPCR